MTEALIEEESPVAEARPTCLKQTAVDVEMAEETVSMGRTSEVGEPTVGNMSLSELRRLILDQTGPVITARLEGSQVERARPPLAADKRIGAPKPAAPTTSVVPSQSPALTQPAAPPKSKRAQKRERRKKAGAPPTAPPAPKDVRPLPPAPATMSEAWVEVAKRGAKPRSTPAQQVEPRRPPAPKKQAVRLRPPRSAAVILKLTPSAVERGITYAEVISQMLGHLRKEDYPSGFTVRRTATGSRIIEIPGVEGEAKADLMVTQLRPKLDPLVVELSRAHKCASMRIMGLDETATAQDVVRAIASAGGCSEEEVRVSQVRLDSFCRGAAVASCPVMAAKKVATGGRLLVGLVSVQVKLLEPRPIRCYRCLKVGHVREQCSEDVDRSAQCYRCGQLGHKAAGCNAAPHCTVCAAAGHPAGHSVGGKECLSPNKVGKKRRRVTRAQSKPPHIPPTAPAPRTTGEEAEMSAAD